MLTKAATSESYDAYRREVWRGNADAYRYSFASLCACPVPMSSTRSGYCRVVRRGRGVRRRVTSLDAVG